MTTYVSKQSDATGFIAWSEEENAIWSQLMARQLSCIQGNYFPELIVWLCDNYNKEELSEEVQKVQDFLVKQMDVMHHVYPTASKLFLQKRKFPISTFTRRNVGKISPSVASDIETLYMAYKDLQDAIPLQEIVC